MSTRKFRPGVGSAIKDAFAAFTGRKRVYNHPVTLLEIVLVGTVLAEICLSVFQEVGL